MPCDRADVDDVAKVALHHARQDQPRELEQASKVDVNELVDVLFGRVQEVAGPGNSGAVDQDIDLQLAHDGGQGRRVGQVHNVRDGTRTIGEFAEAFLVAGNCVNSQAPLGQPLGDRGAHTG